MFHVQRGANELRATDRAEKSESIENIVGSGPMLGFIDKMQTTKTMPALSSEFYFCDASLAFCLFPWHYQISTIFCGKNLKLRIKFLWISSMFYLMVSVPKSYLLLYPTFWTRISQKLPVS